MGSDDFDRPVHMILGLPFDAVRMQDVFSRIRAIPGSGKRCFVSTPNLNFLISARSDAAFRQSVIDSDLSLADGMPIIWIARLLGAPLPERVPGSGLVELLRAAPPESRGPLRIFFFGGETGMAAKACDQLNAEPGGLICVGSIDPGFGTAEVLSGAGHIDRINAAEPDFLIVSLGAKKGQSWLVANRPRLRVAVAAHLGAVIKFIAGDVQRAPAWIQRLGLEWIWRIHEEPSLWRRYIHDGVAFIGLLCTHVFPLCLWGWLHRPRNDMATEKIISVLSQPDGRRLVRLGPSMTGATLDAVRDAFRCLAERQEPADLDFSSVRYFDSAFLGQLCLLHSAAKSKGFALRLVAIPPQIRRALSWSLCDFILE